HYTQFLGRRMRQALHASLPTSASIRGRRRRRVASPTWNTSQHTAMATTWASVTQIRTGRPLKQGYAVAGTCGTQAPGSASKTPSAMAGTPSTLTCNNAPRVYESVFAGTNMALSTQSGSEPSARGARGSVIYFALFFVCLVLYI